MNKKNLTWFTLGSLASSSLSFISIPIIAWVFPDADIGKVALLVSASGLATIFFSMGMDQSYTREFNETTDKATLLLNAAAPGTALMLVIGLIVLLLEPTALSRLLFGEDSTALSAFIVAYLLVVLVSRFLTLNLRMEEDGKRYALSSLLAKLTFVGSVCFSYSKPSPALTDLLIAHGASVAVGLLFLLGATLPTSRQLRWSKLDPRMQRQLLAYGLPVATSGLLFWGLEGVDKFLLRTFSSYSELGIYSIALSISAMATVLTSMFTTVWIPVAYRWIARGEDLQRIDETTRHVLAGALILVGLTGSLSWLLEYVLPAKHSVVQDIIPACMLWPILYAVSETTGLGIAVNRATRAGLFAAGTALCTNVAMNLLLLPSFGSRGAAAALAASIWIFFFMKTEISHRTWRETPRRELYAWTLATLMLAIAHALAGAKLGHWLDLAWGLFLIVAAVSFRISIFFGARTIRSVLSRGNGNLPNGG